MAKLKWGGKITDNHSTATDAAALVIHHVVTFDEVTKISPGIIKHIGGGGERRIKFLPINGGVKAMVRGNGAVQEVFIYTNNPEKTKERLLIVFD